MYQRVEVKTITNKVVSNEPKVKLQAVDDNEPFWSLLEKAAREILTAEEVEKFMGSVKKVNIPIVATVGGYHVHCQFFRIMLMSQT
jgi:hypothetical protein